MLFLHWNAQEFPGASSPGPPPGALPLDLPGSLSGPLDPTPQGSRALPASISCTLRKRFLINGHPAIPCPRAPSSKVTPLTSSTVNLRFSGYLTRMIGLWHLLTTREACICIILYVPSHHTLALVVLFIKGSRDLNSVTRVFMTSMTLLDIGIGCTYAATAIKYKWPFRYIDCAEQTFTATALIWKTSSASLFSVYLERFVAVTIFVFIQSARF